MLINLDFTFHVFIIPRLFHGVMPIVNCFNLLIQVTKSATVHMNTLR